MKIVILGATGMLGSMTLDYLSRDSTYELIATARNQDLMHRLEHRIPSIKWHSLDAEKCSVEEIINTLGEARWAINTIGVIKPYIHDDNAAEVERAVNINALFPHLLAHATEQNGCRILQIATDCVFSGSRGHYTEKDNHDPLDVYGKTKSLGEVYSANVHHLRCSIIGPEPKGHVSLLDWFLGQPRNAGVSGYINHQWNGVTTLHFAKLCQGVIRNDVKLTHVQHVIPAGTIPKAELLLTFAREYQRDDINVESVAAATVINRTLSTIYEDTNRQLWETAGYARPPTIPEMVAELAKYDFRFGGILK
jgi:dTDP-4-dehydrorhamnose reductase